MVEKLTGQFRAIKGSELQRLIVKFIEEKYGIEVDIMDASFWVKGFHANIKVFAFDSCSTKEEQKEVSSHPSTD